MSRSMLRLMALGGAMLLPSLGTSIANVALPALGTSFGASFGAVQWVVIAYLLSVTAFVVVGGRLGDMFGRRRLLLTGMATFAAASLLGAFAPGLGVLIAARALQGLGAALMMALTVAMVGDLVPRDRVGGTVGLLGTISAVGTGLGPTLGGLLLALAGWQAVFLAMALAGVLAFALAVTVLPAETSRPRTARMDLPGMGLLTLALAAFALTFARSGSIPPGAGPGLMALSAVLLAVFLWVERRAPAPLVPLDLLRSGGLAPSMIAMALVSSIVMATLVIGPFWLTKGLGLGGTATGLVMSIGPGVSALAGWPAGRLVDRLGPVPVARLGLGLNLAGCLGLAFVAPRMGVTGYAVSLAVTTLGYATFQAANTAAVMRRAGPEQRGLASALLALARNIGLVAGASAMASVYLAGTAGVARLGLAAGPASGLTLAFGLSSLAAVTAIASVDWPRFPRS